MATKLPLEGIRVLDASIVYAGPYAGMLLGAMGAEVIKIEAIQRPDQVRGAGLGLGVPDNKPEGNFWNQGAIINATNRNKKDLTLDLTNPRGIELFKELVKVSDIFLQNFTPRVVKNFGLTYDVLSAINPSLIMLSSCGYGATGPYSDYRAMGMSMEGAIGLLYITGYENGQPSRARVAFTDFQAARYNTLAMLIALQHRRKTGRGQHIDMAQYEAGTWWIGPAILDYTMNGRVQDRTGNKHPFMAPHGCYRCRGSDNWVTIAVGSDDEWKALCETFEQPALANDPRFADSLSRLKHQDELDAIINEWTSPRDQNEVMNLLQSKGVAAGAVLNAKGVLSDPHLKARNMWEKVTHRPEATNVGTRIFPRMPWVSKKIDFPPSTPAPVLGQDNYEILNGILGLTDDQINQLESDAVIGTVPPDAIAPRVAPVELMIQQGLIEEFDPNYMEVLGLK
ncbi:MAG: CoA transferase [Dehalococcoidia bacterium]|nr:CoA transferase [Dehalococcoidia bacterium]